MDKQRDKQQDVSETFLRSHSLSTSDPKLLNKCSDDLFLCLDVNFDYPLGISLGLAEADIKAIEKDKDSDKDRVIAIFWKWKKIKGSDATYLALIDSFLKCQNTEAAEKVIQYLKTKPTATPHPPSSIRSTTSPEFKAQLSLPLSPNQYPHESSCTRSMSHPVETQTRVRCEKNPNNKAWKILDRHHDHLVNIICSDATLCNDMLNLLAESFLIASAERDVIQQLSCLNISSKAMMRYVSAFISQARSPVRAFVKFMNIIQKFEAFRAVFTEMKSEAFAVEIFIRDLGLSVKATKLPVMTSEKELSCNFSDDTDSDVCKLPPIKSYSRHLKMCYKKDKPDPKWSLESAPSDVYVDLAVVKKDQAYSDAFSKSTIRGTCDDIFRLKEPLSIEKLCSIEYGEAILIEGAPGIGKSMLAFEICRRWVKGEALKNYPLLLLLRLREKFIQKCKTVQELLGCFLNEQSWKDEAIQSIIDNSGEGLIIIFEGFDELPEDLTEADSVFLKFSNELPCASLIYTSCPSARHYLRQEMSFNRHVEVIGFTKESIDQYIKEFFKYNDEHIAAFNRHLDESPKIRDCLYIPVNLIIICSILLQCITNKEQVPLRGIVTSTKLYEAMIKMLLYRHIKSQNPGKLVNVDLNDLPRPIEEQFLSLCQMAFKGLRNRATELLFYPKGDFETLGMMQKEIQVYPVTGDVIAYSFLHLTIQEFLAAYHISQMPRNDIEDVFRRYKNVMKFSTMLRFVAGLTDLQSITPCVDEKLFSMTLFHCLYESGNDSLTRFLFCDTDKLHKVRRLLPLPTPQDMYILGKCIALSNCRWGLSFTLRGMTADYVEKFQRGLGFVKSGVSCIIEDISFSLNPIGDEGIIELLSFPQHILENLVSLRLMSCGLKSSSVIELAKQFRKFRSLNTLFFHNNQLKEGEQLPLLKAMTTAPCPLQYCRITFSKLSPEECSVLLTKAPINKVELYQLESCSIQSVIECLPESHSLQILHIEQTQCTVENLCLLPTTLPFSSIKRLELINCAIDSNSVCTVIEAVLKSPHLEALNLQDNFIDDEGGTHLCAMLRRIFGPSKEPISSSRSSNKFKYLGIGHNPFKEPGISGFIKELAQFKDATFTLSLSLGWKEFASTLNLFPKVKDLLEFECNEKD